jgi:RNA polymerase sigma-70 factor (ECF subfamily)
MVTSAIDEARALTDGDDLVGILLQDASCDDTRRTGIARRLQEMLAEARRAWPGLPGDERDYVRFLAGRVHGPDCEAELTALRAGDLWLAHRCALGDAAALRELMRAVRPDLDAVLRDPSARGVDAVDLEQHLLERLFADGPNRPAKIHDYGGRGPLGRWVHVVALRIRVDSERRRGDKDGSLVDHGEALVDATDDPELAYLKEHYRDAFRRAFGESLAALTPRERTLLRLQVVHGRSATSIAELYHVHRATAKRWLVDVRAGLLADTRERLQRTLSVDPGELDSIMRLIGSRLEASVRAHLADEDDPT